MGLRHPVFVSRFAHNWDWSANLLWQKSDIFEILPKMDTVSILQVPVTNDSTLYWQEKESKSICSCWRLFVSAVFWNCAEMSFGCVTKQERARLWKWLRKISLVFLCRCTFTCVACCERVSSILSSIARMCAFVCDVVQVWVALFC